MNRNVKNIIVTICFVAITAGFMLTNLILADTEFSVSERRKLKQIPSYSIEKLLSGEYFAELEKYTLDQFALRDSFRRIAAYTRYYALAQKDNNGIYIVNRNNINQVNYPLNEKSVLNAAKKFNEVSKKYFTGKGIKVYYSVIPDKNYFVAAQNGYPHIDYEILQEILAENIDYMKYIDIFDHLGIEDFYRTDIHWQQEKIIDVADKLLAEMGSKQAASEMNYEQKSLYPFYGSYYRQAALKIAPDELIYLTNKSIENAEVYDYALNAYGKVYSPGKLQGVDPYDVFLSGPVPLITVSNPSCTTGKELILFRDSFGSSIAPLLISSYIKITLVDLRYIATDHIGQYIDFTEKQDVLFLYNTQILNNSYMLK